MKKDRTQLLSFLFGKLAIKIADNYCKRWFYGRAAEMTLGVNANLKSDDPAKLNSANSYSGGRLQIKIQAGDTQRDFVWRGLYEHAKVAGLTHEECVKFADKWALDKLQYQENGKTLSYTDKEFAVLKKKGETNFDLPEGAILTDLRQRQADFRASLKPQDSMSAPNYTESEKAVKWMTDSIQSWTGTETEVGKQFNRLAVSSLRLMGNLQELKNKATESINGVIRDYAPDSVDQILDDSDKINRENAQALKNANTIVTNNDRIDDLYAAKNGIKRPVAEDLHRKLMYFPEAIPNTIDSAIKGDFKDDDGSYSDTVGKIIGGLNPAGDVRDIIANGKNLIDGKEGAGIGLGAAIIGAIPLIGDGGKIFYKTEKKAITEAIEKFVKQGIEKETAEKLAKEEVGKLTKEAEAQIAKEEAARISKRYSELEKEGHAPARHGEHITEQQLDDRAIRGFDPITGTTDDAFRKNADGTPKKHNYGGDATKFVSKEDLVKSENYIKNTQQYKDALDEAKRLSEPDFVVNDIKLEDIFGSNYKDSVFGKTRTGTKNHPTGSIPTDFTDGTIKAVFKKDASGNWNLDTMFPKTKN